MNWNPFTWFRKAAPQPHGSWMPAWQPSINHISRKPRTERECINLFRDTAYFCANLNARGVARTQLCMYKKASGTDYSFNPNARRLGHSTEDRETRFRLKSLKYISADDEVDEIVGHPFLELLDRPFYADGVSIMGRFTFLEITQLYLEIVGRAYWEMDTAAGGERKIPSQLFPLVAHEVEPYRATGSPRFVDVYRYQEEHGRREIDPSEIIAFLVPNLTNPYTGGYSPMMAAGDRVGVSMSYLGQTQAFLDNRARPDMILSPKHPDGILSKPSEGRIKKWMKANFSRDKIGSPMVLTEPMEMIPLQFALKDLGELQDEENSTKNIARCFDVPLSMLDKDANLASASEGRKQHAFDAIEPRCRRLEQAINANIMRRYDPTGNTICMFGEPYREPLAPTPTDLVSLTGPVLMPNESRELMGFGPMPKEYEAQLEKQRQDALAAKKPPTKPSESKAVTEFRRRIRNGEVIRHRH